MQQSGGSTNATWQRQEVLEAPAVAVTVEKTGQTRVLLSLGLQPPTALSASHGGNTYPLLHCRIHGCGGVVKLEPAAQGSMNKGYVPLLLIFDRSRNKL